MAVRGFPNEDQWRQCFPILESAICRLQGQKSFRAQSFFVFYFGKMFNEIFWKPRNKNFLHCVLVQFDTRKEYLDKNCVTNGCQYKYVEYAVSTRKNIFWHRFSWHVSKQKVPTKSENTGQQTVLDSKHAWHTFLDSPDSFSEHVKI